MGKAGFIYVLANLSMPGLVKVGKTTREPANRANELSGATGVATPFIVLYQEFFDDCDKAEDFVHSYLVSKGHRVSPNREFFNAPTYIVVEAIVKAPGKADPASLVSSNTGSAVSKEHGNAPWNDLVKRASDIMSRKAHTLDTRETPKTLLEQAVALGSPEACEMLAPLYWKLGRWEVRTKQDQRDRERALELYTEGARRGNIRCLPKLATLYSLNWANNVECWRRFFEAIRTNPTLIDTVEFSNMEDCYKGMRCFLSGGQKSDSPELAMQMELLTSYWNEVRIVLGELLKHEWFIKALHNYKGSSGHEYFASWVRYYGFDPADYDRGGPDGGCRLSSP